MNTQPTPEPKTITVKTLQRRGILWGASEWIRTCSQLERERDEAREELSEWRILNGWGGTPEIINDFIKGQQTRIHHAQDLDAELAAVTDQRDELRKANEIISGREGEWIAKAHYDLDCMKEQRDRLAEALEDIRARCQDKTIELHPDSDAKGCVDDCLEWSEQALQSLTPKP
jgi:hypothetical protein